MILKLTLIAYIDEELAEILTVKEENASIFELTTFLCQHVYVMKSAFKLFWFKPGFSSLCINVL